MFSWTQRSACCWSWMPYVIARRPSVVLVEAGVREKAEDAEAIVHRDNNGAGFSGNVATVIAWAADGHAAVSCIEATTMDENEDGALGSFEGGGVDIEEQAILVAAARTEPRCLWARIAILRGLQGRGPVGVRLRRCEAQVADGWGGVRDAQEFSNLVVEQANHLALRSVYLWCEWRRLRLRATCHHSRNKCRQDDCSNPAHCRSCVGRRTQAWWLQSNHSSFPPCFMGAFWRSCTIQDSGTNATTRRYMYQRSWPPAVGFRDGGAPHRLWPVPPGMDPVAEVPDVGIQVPLVVRHRHPIHASAGCPPLPPERSQQRRVVHMVQQRREAGLARSSPPPRSPERAWLAENPGPVSGPSRVEAFPPVGSLPSPPSSVLRPDPPPRFSSASSFGSPLPLAPSGDLTGGPRGFPGSDTFLHARNGLRPRQSGDASHNGADRVAFATTDRLGLCNFSDVVAQFHSPHDRCVRFSPAVTGRTCNTRYRAARHALTGRDFHPLDRASFAWRTHCSPDPNSKILFDVYLLGKICILDTVLRRHSLQSIGAGASAEMQGGRSSLMFISLQSQ